MKGINGFTNGMSAYRRGLQILRKHPDIYPYVIIPFILNVILYIGIIVVSFLYFQDWYESFAADKTAWYWTYLGLKYLTWVFYLLLLFAFCFFTFIPIGSIVTAPFNDMISQKIEAVMLPESVEPGGGWKGFLVDIWLALYHMILRLVVFLVLAIVMLPLLFIPVVGQAAFAYLSIRFLAWEVMDFCMARKRMSFSEKGKYMKRHRAETMGLGAITFLFFLIPFTALFVLPMSAVAGTVLYCEIKNREADIVVEGDGSVAR